MLDDEHYEVLYVEKLHIRRRLIYVFVFYFIGCVFYMHEEPWSVIDAVYFITLTITSVGYGDLQPSTIRCKCFTIVYAIIGLAAIFGMVGEAITEYLEHVQTQAMERATSDKESKYFRHEQDLKIGLSVVGVVGVIVGGGICYSYLEGWPLVDGIYFSCMTTLTVGYGDLVVTSQLARFFSIIYMTLSVIVFAVAVGNLQAVGLARALEERRAALLNKELDLDALFRLDEDGDGKVTLVEFLTGALHQISGIDPEKEIHPWIRRFHELDVDGNGYLDENDLVEIRKESKTGTARLTRLSSREGSPEDCGNASGGEALVACCSSRSRSGSGSAREDSPLLKKCDPSRTEYSTV